MKTTITCLIPFYNEQNRILKVLEKVVRIKEINELICIDDGSSDNASNIIKKKYPYIKLIRTTKNQGKTEAVALGLKKAKGTYILLLDADLQNFQYKEIESAILTIKNAPTIDMIILKRNNKRLFRTNILISGERILSKKDLLQILAVYKPKGVEIEFAINQYMMDNHKSVYWMPISAANYSSIKKRGIIKGINKIISMHVEIYSYIGLYNTLRQVLFFCKEQAL